MTSTELYREVKELKSTVSLMERRIEMLEMREPPRQPEIDLPPHLHLAPDLMERMVEKEKEKLLEGKNMRAMSSSSDYLKRMRRLEERVEEVEEEIVGLKKLLERREEEEKKEAVGKEGKEERRKSEEELERKRKEEETVPPKLNLRKSILI